MVKPNVIVFLADDMGYSDLGCFGSEIHTPAIDALAQEGVRMTRFYNGARCSPSRASLLTGRHPHEVGIGVLTGNHLPFGYRGDLASTHPTIAETLKGEGYVTGLVGKWHLSDDNWNVRDSWPTRRGFDFFYGTLAGAGSYYDPPSLTRGEELEEDDSRDPEFYYTRAITEEAERFVRSTSQDAPFFLYVSYTAPHFPLHAPEESVRRYENMYNVGWDELRKRRLARQKDLGIIPDHVELGNREHEGTSWIEAPDKEWEARRMAVYAAQISEMDTSIGQIVATLRELGELDNTLILFLSDNGASAEEMSPESDNPYRERTDQFRKKTRAGDDVQLGNSPAYWPGGEDTYLSYGPNWANLSNTPFRRFKRWTHEGGVSTPLIVSWPDGGIPADVLSLQRAQLTSIAPTILEAVGAPCDEELAPLSLLPAMLLEEETDWPLFWEHIGNAAVRIGKWKLVREFEGSWELYDTAADPTEGTDLAAELPEVVRGLSDEWHSWASRTGVKDFAEVVRGFEAAGLSRYQAVR